MAFSYSFHLSNKGNAISNVQKIKQAGKHNLRKYQSADYDRDQIEILRGSDNALADVKAVYQSEFEQCLEEYNANVRADRQITDYLEHVSNSRSDCAAEIIIQLGDKEFWANKSPEEKRQMTHIFKDQLRSMEKLVPEFKVANATVHFDEASPHMHVIGVPVADGYKKGMAKQVAKTKVFTKAKLAYLQAKMRENAEKGMNLPENANLFAETALKTKEKGRNKDLPKESYIEYKNLTSKANIAEIKRQIKNININVKTAEMMLNKNRVTIDKSELENLKKRAKLSTVYEKATAEKADQAEQKLKLTRAICDTNIAKTKAALDSAEKLKADAERKNAELARATLEAKAKGNSYSTIEKRLQSAEIALQNASTDINTLQAENTQIKAKYSVLQAEANKVPALQRQLAAQTEKYENLSNCFAEKVVEETAEVKATYQRQLDHVAELVKNEKFEELKKMLEPVKKVAENIQMQFVCKFKNHSIFQSAKGFHVFKGSAEKGVRDTLEKAKNLVLQLCKAER